jgi:hypothetical protein
MQSPPVTFGMHVTGSTAVFQHAASATGSSLPVMDGPNRAGGAPAELLYLTEGSASSVDKGVVVASGDSSLLDRGSTRRLTIKTWFQWKRDLAGFQYCDDCCVDQYESDHHGHLWHKFEDRRIDGYTVRLRY